MSCTAFVKGVVKRGESSWVRIRDTWNFTVGLGNRILTSGVSRWGFPKAHAYQDRRHKRCRFDPWVGKIPWRRQWQPTPLFLPGKFHGQRSLAGYSLWGCKELNMTERLNYHHQGI